MALLLIQMPTMRTDRQELARELAEEIKTAVIPYRVNYSRKSIICGAAYALAATLVLVLLFIFIARLFRKCTTESR